MKNIDLMKREIESTLSEYRRIHSFNVAEVAKNLAIHYQYDEEKAYIAGLLHDIAKEYTYEQNIAVIRRNNLSTKLLDQNNKKILHARIGAEVAREKFNIDEEIYHAIKYHPFGSIPMDLLDKIVYVADKIEPGKRYPGIEEERIIATTAIDLAVIMCLENNINAIKAKNKEPHPASIKVLKYLKKEVDKND